MAKRQQSSIDRLPDDVRSQLQELLRDPRVTQLDAVARINAILDEVDHPERLSKSAVNRYAVRMEEVGAKIRQSREMAEMWIGKFGAAPQGQLGLLITETLRTLAYELTLKLQDADINDPETFAATIDQVKALALGVQRLEQSTTINVKREQEIRKQTAEAAASVAEKTLVNQGMSRDSIDTIKREILGIA